MYSYNNKNWDCVFGFFKHACDCNANLMIWTKKMGYDLKLYTGNFTFHVHQKLLNQT
jgi:hypothetical protein